MAFLRENIVDVKGYDNDFKIILLMSINLLVAESFTFLKLRNV